MWTLIDATGTSRTFATPIEGGVMIQVHIEASEGNMADTVSLTTFPSADPKKWVRDAANAMVARQRKKDPAG